MSEEAFNVGDRVTLCASPPYLKTADTIPMLRPPDLVAVGEAGIALEQRVGGYWVIKFERGNFLVDARYLGPSVPDSPNPSADTPKATPETS